MDGAMDIPALIKKLRAAGLSQSEIFRRTGIPQPRLSRWENGKSIPPSFDDISRLMKLAEECDRNAEAA